ncbi:nitroreductase family deazaflavin-dependent oxidoreductase [Mangrovimicrobium sediminis]|uniref:Nitroreductase family deazaflavin-dependent oxidoreductase n=1 Tax=Mangrovimicrobium sediminis TaxID=2562682 RepID=A0A4Z0M7T4_9GAMM|nr:nitroreductase/quinone reductase family protein [Haliea sp. SAOS-164]TGD75723.1 nitroreductase family deazaflavin-dependent oxidoreductase [Haliea sp. SAOS-164]
MAFEGSESLLSRSRDFVRDHMAAYLDSGGREGHIVDVSHTGVERLLPTLLLQTIGRKSGRPLLVPLIYGFHGGEWVVIASKAGSTSHPAWYLNLREMEEVRFQVGGQCFRGHWREAQGTEKAAVWDYMCGVFPPYADYQAAAGERDIPVILLRPAAVMPVFQP